MILGTVQLGCDYGIKNRYGQQSHKEALSILDVAFQGGIRTLDTAAGYGESERIISEYGKGSPAAFRICTKLPPVLNGQGQESMREAVSSEIVSRLDSLGVDRLYCCYLHRFSQCKDPDVMDALLSAKDKGLIENIGISIYYPNELEYICNRLSSEVDIVQCPLNVLSFSRWDEAVARAFSLGIVLYARSIFLQGLLLMGPDDRAPTELGISPILRFVREEAERKKVSLPVFCYSFVRQMEGVEDVLVGCETVEQLKENLTLEPAKSLFSSEDIEHYRRVFSVIPDSVLDPSKWHIERETAQ